MIIRKTTFEEKTFNFIIEFESGEKLSISYDSYEAYKLSTGIDLDDFLLEKLREEDQFIFARKKALNFIDYKARSEFEVKKKLRSLGVEDPVINLVIDDLVKKSYLDDSQYAREFLRQCLELKKYSLLLSRQKLYQKGISKDIIDKLFENDNLDIINIENARYQAEKKSRNKDLSDRKIFQKVYRYLLSKGFSYEISKQVLDELRNDE